jgi:hypothetical protein
MTNETNFDKIKTRISALLAKAKGTDNEHEAAAFIAKAEELLELYQIDLSELGDASDKVKQHVGIDADGKWVASWHRQVYRALARYYGCKSIKVATNKGYRQEVVGRESAIVTTDLMFVFIKGECNRLGRELKANGGAPTDANGARLVGNVLATRVFTLIREREARDEANPSTAAAKNSLLVLDQVVALYKELYPDVTLLKGTKTKSTASARELADTIGLHRQAGHTAALQIGGR